MDNSITAGELSELLAAGKPLTLLDVRRKEDFDQAPQTFAGAQWQNPAEIDQWLPTIPEDQEVIVYCVRGGSVSQSVRQRLEDSGRKAHFVAGGLVELAKERRP